MSSIKKRGSDHVLNALFGPNAFWGSSRVTRDQRAETFANDLLEIVVNAQLSQLKWTTKAIARAEVTVTKAWESAWQSIAAKSAVLIADGATEVEKESKVGIDTNKAKIIAALRQYTKATNIAIGHLESFGLTEDRARAAELADRLEDIKKAMSQSQDVTGEWRVQFRVLRELTDRSELPADVVKALVGLSGVRATEELQEQIDEALGSTEHNGDEFMLAAPQQVTLDHWNLEAELAPWNSMATEELWKLIGPTQVHKIGGEDVQTIVGMAPCHDTHQRATSWGRADGKHWWEDPDIDAARKSPVRLNHHQLVGVLKAINWLGAGKGGLLADEVGVGKTAQVIATIQLRELLIYMQQNNRAYPPGLGKWFSLCIRLSER